MVFLGFFLPIKKKEKKEKQRVVGKSIQNVLYTWIKLPNNKNNENYNKKVRKNNIHTHAQN